MQPDLESIRKNVLDAWNDLECPLHVRIQGATESQNHDANTPIRCLQKRTFIQDKGNEPREILKTLRWPFKEECSTTSFGVPRRRCIRAVLAHTPEGEIILHTKVFFTLFSLWKAQKSFVAHLRKALCSTWSKNFILPYSPMSPSSFDPESARIICISLRFTATGENPPCPKPRSIQLICEHHEGILPDTIFCPGLALQKDGIPVRDVAIHARRMADRLHPLLTKCAFQLPLLVNDDCYILRVPGNRLRGEAARLYRKERLYTKLHSGNRSCPEDPPNPDN